MLDVLHPQPVKAAHKDKLAETKKHEAEVHEALKAQQHAEKNKKKQEHKEDHKAFKEERAYKMEKDPDMKHSKRAEHEAREAVKKAEKEDGMTCEHGVHKCRICFPHKQNKELAHGHEKAPVVTGFADDE